MDQSYEIADEVIPPGLPGRVVLRPSLDAALEAAAADLFLQAHACVRAFGDFHLAMGYGPGEHRLIVRLMTDPNYRDLPWSRTHLWSLAEHRVAVGDERHSHTHLREMVLEASDLPVDQAHPLQAHLHDAEDRFEAELREHLGQREPGHDRIDCVVLPPEGAMLRGWNDPLGRLVGASEDGDRVGLTARAIRGGRFVMVLATGDDSAPLVRSLAADHGAVGVVPLGGELRWYLDHRACGAENTEDPA
jgi:6-phosphogluconolactonase/glucosamine-6-phosphate isomerase/deaminase